MNNKKTKSVLNLKNTPLVKILIGAAKGKLTGCIKIKQAESRLNIWWIDGEIAGVSGITSLFEKLDLYNMVSKRVLPNIKSEELIAPLGDKLSNAYGIKSEDLTRLFKEQIDEIINHIGDIEGEIVVAKVKKSTFPWQELTGLKASGYEVVKTALEKNFTSRYKNKVPERERTVEAGITELDQVNLEKEYLKIISFCNTNATLLQIAKKLDIPLSKLQKQIYILNVLELVQIGITKDAALELFRKFNPQGNIMQGRNVTFAQKKSWFVPVASISVVNLLIIAITSLGGFQSTELGIFDRLIRTRGTQPNQDITIVTIDDQDISEFPTYPIADTYLAQVLRNLAEANPSAIGLDIYRELPQNPGHDQLLTAYKDIPQLIGVEKIDESDRVNPPPILGAEGRVGFSDLVLDSDNVLRRGTWMVESNNNQVKFNLGALTALQHLSTKTLYNGKLNPITNKEQNPVPIIQDDKNPYVYTIGDTTFSHLTNNSGGYWRKQIVGLQKIISFRYKENDFKTISFLNTYQGKFDPKDIEGKIVLIGVTADSKKDFVYTPLSRVSSQSRSLPGVMAHANIAADLIDAARGVKQIQVESKTVEIAWIITWSLLGVGVGIAALELNLKSKQKTYIVVFLQGATLTIASFACGAAAFLLGSWWIPVIPNLTNALASAIIANFQYQNELKALVYADKQSKVANRHYFDNLFETYLLQVQAREGNLGLVLTQIIDWEMISQKLDPKDSAIYLREIAKEIEQRIKLENPDNLIGRFADNTFAAIVLDTNPVKLQELVNSISKAINVNPRLAKVGLPTLGFGTAISDRKRNNTLALIAEADEQLTKV